MFNKIIYTLDVLMVMSKAFDIVNHKILPKKLSHYGMKNKNLDWFTQCLSNIKQCIGHNVNSKSTLFNIVCRVPQGSILGPLLFLLYTSDLPQESKLCLLMIQTYFIRGNMSTRFFTL